jgi:hypothetical protein
MPTKEFPGAGGKPKASEVLQHAAEMERDARERSRAWQEYGQTLYIQIKNTGWLPGGVDKLIAGRRVRKPILKAAEACAVEATLWHTLRATWLAQFGDPTTARKQSVDFTS